MSEAVKALETMRFSQTDGWLRSVDARPHLEKIIAQARDYPSFVLRYDGSIVCVCGIVLDGRAAELWMVQGEGFGGRAAVQVKRQQMSLIKSMIDAFGLVTLVMAIDPARDDAQRWAAHLGFVFYGEVESNVNAGQVVQCWRYPIYQHIDGGPDLERFK